MPSLGNVVANLKSDEWELRVDGLKQLQALGEGATSAEGRKALAASLKGEGVADLVTKQLRDLRSVVAATACRCAAALAKALGAEGTQPLCDAWTSTLLAVVSSGAPKVVQKVALEASQALVDGAAPRGNASLFHRLCDAAATAKAPPARRAACDLAARALRGWEPEPALGAAGDVVVARARDADGAVRKAARELWLALRHAGFRESADRAAERLDASTRRQLDKDAAAAPPPKAALAHAAPAPAAPAPRPARAKTRAAPSPRRTPRAAHTAYRGGATARRAPSAPSSADEADLAPAPPEVAASEVAAPEVAAPEVDDGPEEHRAGEGDDASAAVLVNALAEQCCSPHWDLRRDGVVALRSALASPRVAAASGDGVAWRSLAEATHDAHHKVNLAALEALAATLRGCSDAVAGEAFSARVLDPGQFDGAATVLGCAAVGAAKRLVDPRQPTRHAAGQALHELRRTFAPAVLLEGVAPALDRCRPLKARAALHEFAAAVARVDGDAGRRGFFDDAARLGDVVLRVARTLDQTLDRGPGDDGAAAAFAAAARLAVAVRRCDAEAFADRCAALAAEHRRAVGDALRDLAPGFDAQLKDARRRHVARRAAPAEVLADAPPPPPPAAGGPPPPPAPGGGVTEEAARKTLGDAVAVLSRPGGGGAAADAGRAARGDVARLARLAGPAVDAAWRGYFDSLAHLLLERACASGPPDAGRDAFLEGDESDDSDDGRSPGDRGGLRRAPTMSLDDLAARHESLGALRTLARRRPRDFRFCLDAAVPRLLALSRDGRVPLELAWAAERVLDAAAARGDAARVLALALPDLADAAPPAGATPRDVARLDLQRSRAPLCRVLAACARRAPAAALRGALPSALPPLSSAAGAPAADVRKAAVDALVELYVALGDALVPKLKLHLRDDQVKLVGMFVHKRAATKAAAAAA